MQYQDILIRESATLPEYLKRELIEFLHYLKAKEGKAISSGTNSGKMTKPPFGCGKVHIQISPDFDAPIDDFKDYES